MNAPLILRCEGDSEQTADFTVILVERQVGVGKVNIEGCKG
jgi:hypothetical protein